MEFAIDEVFEFDVEQSRKRKEAISVSTIYSQQDKTKQTSRTNGRHPLNSRAHQKDLSIVFLLHK